MEVAPLAPLPAERPQRVGLPGARLAVPEDQPAAAPGSNRLAISAPRASAERRPGSCRRSRPRSGTSICACRCARPPLAAERPERDRTIRCASSGCATGSAPGARPSRSERVDGPRPRRGEVRRRAERDVREASPPTRSDSRARCRPLRAVAEAVRGRGRTALRGSSCSVGHEVTPCVPAPAPRRGRAKRAMRDVVEVELPASWRARDRAASSLKWTCVPF